MCKAGAALLAAALAAASIALLLAELALAQEPPTQVAAAQPPPETVPQPTAEAGSQADAYCPGHPDALGTSRVLALDPAAYPRIGRMQYPNSLPLNNKEVVLTFDDGPLPPSSNQ